MLRDRELSEIYDGNFYLPDDLVPVGCRDCEGCSECCRSTGDSIVLDPYDMYMLLLGTGKNFEDMIEREIEIRLVDGLILPNLMQHREGPEEHLMQHREGPEEHLMQHREGPEERSGTVVPGEDGDRCAFLSETGRCSIHPFRPGICRLYPMGRYYEGSGFRYILQKDECISGEKSRVLLREWLGIENLPEYEAYILDWHDFKLKAEAGMRSLTPGSRESVARYILQIFFVHPYQKQMDFYSQYRVRREVCGEALAQILSV